MALIPRSIIEKSKSSVIYLVLFVGLIFLVRGIYQGGVHLVELKAETVTLPDLPAALLLSFLRMLGAYFASIVFAYIFGVIAARSAWGERIVLPVLDILQSVPVVGFFPAAITFFIGITQGHRIGVELSCMFLIFTSQAWNLGFSVYESLKSIPLENEEAVFSLGLNNSQRFFNLFVPASIPRLAYNSILSWSNGWFFLVACEIIAVGPVKYDLPGIGSFLARAAEDENLSLVLWGLLSLATLILMMDLLVWRPILAWSNRFKQDMTSNQDEEDVGFFLDLPKTISSKFAFLYEPALRIIYALLFPVRWFAREVLFPIFWDLPAALFSGVWREFSQPVEPWLRRTQRIRSAIGYFSLGFLVIFSAFYFWNWMKGPMPEVMRDIPLAILYSTGRIAVALVISFLWILPLIYFVWNRPKYKNICTTIAQLGASLPATALFPLIVLVGIKRMGGGMDLATLILLTFAIQWYVLFNAIGGVALIPSELIDATKSFGLSNFQTFKRLVFPTIRPALITGAITAWGGGWNALVVSEYITVKDTVMKVKGLGALLSTSVYELGDARAITLCIGVMVAWILMLNLLMWQPLYHRNLEKFKF
jgi:NitT/TauT family transport system permease protein